MAAIGVALWKYVMRYAPHTPTYFNRDRFVLSNGKRPFLKGYFGSTKGN
jgi:dihydroxyacetone synthase